MIPRYEKKEISKIWSDESRYRYFLQAELAILKAQEGSNAPDGVSQEIKNNCSIDADRILEIEKEVKHDIIAFCTNVCEGLPTEVSKFFHFGITSSDIIDTTMNLQIRDSLKLVLGSYRKLLQTLKSKSNETKHIITLGRSHGRNAEPMSFGQKFLSYFAEFSRRYEDYIEFMEKELTAQFSGAVGNYTLVTPEHERKACENLGLTQEPISTQVIPRDRLAKLISIGAMFGSALERISVELRHLHHSDIDEIEEGFAKGQKGSSTMPHKRNPIATENLSGMARVLRSHMSIALENIVLWHERDISHSSTERLYLPDHLGLLLYAVERLNNTLENLVIKKENIEKKVFENFDYLSSYYLHEVLRVSNYPREEVYYWVQEAAFAGKEQNSPMVFHRKLKTTLERHGVSISLPDPDEQGIKSIYLKHVEEIFNRVFKAYHHV